MPIWWVGSKALLSTHFSFITVEHLFKHFLVNVFKLPAHYFHLPILLDYFFLLIFRVPHMFSVDLPLLMWIANIYKHTYTYSSIHIPYTYSSWLFFFWFLLLLRKLKFWFSNFFFLPWFYFSHSRKAFFLPWVYKSLVIFSSKRFIKGLIFTVRSLIHLDLVFM